MASIPQIAPWLWTNTNSRRTQECPAREKVIDIRVENWVLQKPWIRTSPDAVTSARRFLQMASSTRSCVRRVATRFTSITNRSTRTTYTPSSDMSTVCRMTYESVDTVDMDLIHIIMEHVTGRCTCRPGSIDSLLSRSLYYLYKYVVLCLIAYNLNVFYI